MDRIQNLNLPEADTDGIILYSKDLNTKYEYGITKHYAVNTFLNGQLFRNLSFLICIWKICITSIRVFVSHSDTYKIYILGYSTSEQDDLHQWILKASKNNISFPQDVMDLMQCYTENPDDILPAEFEIISNHLDAAIDMEGDTVDFPLHTHLVCIYLLKF